MTGVAVDNLEQLELRVAKQDKALAEYRLCIEKMDAYLDGAESEKDAIWMQAMIDKLTGTLRAIGV
jgi:uncharacterized coiled-coil protein SlyX